MKSDKFATKYKTDLREKKAITAITKNKKFQNISRAYCDIKIYTVYLKENLRHYYFSFCLLIFPSFLGNQTEGQGNPKILETKEKVKGEKR